MQSGCVRVHAFFASYLKKNIFWQLCTVFVRKIILVLFSVFVYIDNGILCQGSIRFFLLYKKARTMLDIFDKKGLFVFLRF